MLIPAQIYREFQLRFAIAKKMRQKMKSRVPRCLFGPSNPKDDANLLKETLDMDRARFSKRWGVDPLAEEDDKENGPCGCTRVTPSKKRVSPYAKQTSIHDYWRSRKNSDSSKKSPNACTDVLKQQQQPQSPQSQPLSLNFSPLQRRLQFETEFNTTVQTDSQMESIPQETEAFVENTNPSAN